MPKHMKPPQTPIIKAPPEELPLTFLEALELRQKVVSKRLNRLARRIPRPGLLIISDSIRGPASLAVEAQHLAGLFGHAIKTAADRLGNDPNSVDNWIALTKAYLYATSDRNHKTYLREARRSLAMARRMLQEAGEQEGPELLYLRAWLTRDELAALEMAMDACEADATYADAHFLCARLALKQGFEEGQAILKQIGPYMGVSPLKNMYKRVMEELAA